MPDAASQTPAAPRDLPGLQIGVLRDSDVNFRRLVLFLARDPLYATSQLGRLTRLDYWLAHHSVLVANLDGTLVGACTWSQVETALALRSIEQRKLPGREEMTDTGPELLLTLITGSRPGVVNRLIRHVMAMHRGRIILYTRHRSKGRKVQRFGWIDRESVPQGPSL